MFKVGEVVIHKHDVCKITEINKNFRDGEDYYTLRPLDDDSLIIRTPVSNQFGLLRKVMSKKEAEALIEQIPDIEPVELDSRILGAQYKKLLDSGTHHDLIRIIKTSYLRKEEKLKEKLKANENDKIYFRLAEKILYSELAQALGVPYGETERYVLDTVSDSVNDTDADAAEPAAKLAQA